MTTTAIGFSTARKNARATQHAGWLAGGTLKGYDGTRPASTDTAITTQAHLITFVLADPFGSVSGAIINASTIAAAMALATSTITWARAYDSSDVVIGDYDVGELGSNAAVILDDTDLIEGGLASILSFTITEG